MSPPAPLPNHPTVTSALLPPLPTPHWGAQSSPAFTVRATTTIAASPSLILSSLLDTSTWPQWNNFVPRATVHNDNDNKNNSKLQPGILFTGHVSMRGRGRSSIVKMRLLMTTLEEISDDYYGRKGWRVVWLGKNYPDWALRSERVHEIYELEGEEGTVYNCFETMSGPLAWFVRVFVGRMLVDRFGQWNGELKGFVEGMGEGRERGGEEEVGEGKIMG